eukprot:4772902-Amphidinium_carterae.3
MGGTQRIIYASHAIQAWYGKKTAQKCTSIFQLDGTLSCYHPANHHPGAMPKRSAGAMRNFEADAAVFGNQHTRDRYIYAVANRMFMNACVGATSATSRALYAAAMQCYLCCGNSSVRTASSDW